MSTMVKRVWGYRYVILGIVWLLYFINYLDRMAVLTFLPYIQKDLNLTPVEVGQLASVFFFAYALAQITAGFMTDKLGPKRVMNIAIFVFTAVTALTGVVKTFGQFIALRIGLGLGEGHHFVPGCRAINNWFPVTERGRAVSFFVSSAVAATAVAPVLLAYTSFYLLGGEWRPVFYLLAIPGVIGLILLWKYVSDSPAEMLERGKITDEEYEYITEKSKLPEEEVIHKTNTRQSIGIFLKDPSFHLFCVLLFCQAAVYWGTTTWLTTFLVKQHGLNLKEMGLVASAPYIVAVFSMIAGGWLMDKVFFRMKPVGLIAYIGSIPVLLLLGTVEKGNTGLLVGLLMLVGFFVNFNYGSVYAYLQQRYPKEVVGRATGIGNGIGYLGSFVSPLVAGYLVKVNIDGSQDFGSVFVFFAATSAVAALCTFLLKEQRSV